MTLAETIASKDNALKVEELAKLLNCSKAKLYKMVDSGRIPYIKIGTAIRFDPKTIATWIENRSLDLK